MNIALKNRQAKVVGTNASYKQIVSIQQQVLRSNRCSNLLICRKNKLGSIFRRYVFKNDFKRREILMDPSQVLVNK